MARKTKEQWREMQSRDVEKFFFEDGDFFLIRNLTNKEEERWEREQAKALKSKKITQELRASLIAICVVDESGKPEFTEAELQEDMARHIIPLFDFCKKKNRIFQEDRDFLDENSEKIGD